jgi:hypothetical protein
LPCRDFCFGGQHYDKSFILDEDNGLTEHTEQVPAALVAPEHCPDHRAQEKQDYRQHQQPEQQLP